MSKTYGDFVKELLYEEPTDICYMMNPDEPRSLDNMIEVRDPSYFSLNLLSMTISWEHSGRYEARKALSRAKYRKLCKAVNRRYNNLRRKYRVSGI